MVMQKRILRIPLIIIAIVLIAGGPMLGNLVGVANAQLQPVKYDWKVTKVTVFSSNKTADGITHTLFAATYNWTGDIEGTWGVTHTRDVNLQTGIGKAIVLGIANVKILGKGPDKITCAADVTLAGLKDGIIQLEGLWWCFDGQGVLKGAEGQGTVKGVSIPGKSAGTGEGQVRFGPEIVETVSPISYAVLGIGIVLIAVSAVLFTRQKKV